MSECMYVDVGGKRMISHKGKLYDASKYYVSYLDDAPPFCDMGPDYVWKPDIAILKIPSWAVQSEERKMWTHTQEGLRGFVWGTITGVVLFVAVLAFVSWTAGIKFVPVPV